MCLHYVFDLWIEAWRQKVATGDVIVVRYADDLVVGFENRTEPSDSWKHFGNDWQSSGWNYLRRKHD
jgi:RNA-directed DNA polymerase